MANIQAGTTGQAEVTYNTGSDDCVLCNAAGTFGFDTTSEAAPGWSASYDEETISVPPEAAPGDYMIGVRTSATIMNDCGNGSAPCKHLSFTVVATDTPPSGPGPQIPPC